MSTGDAVEVYVAIVLTMTLLAVLLYTRATTKQAEASIDMSKEARRSRMDELRPVLTLQSFTQEDPHPNGIPTKEVLLEMENNQLWCRLMNVGRGSALNIQGYVFDSSGEPQTASLGNLIQGGNDSQRHAFAVHDGNVEVTYEDVFGRTFYSRRTVTFNERGPWVGFLETGLKGESE